MDVVNHLKIITNIAVLFLLLPANISSMKMNDTGTNSSNHLNSTALKLEVQRMREVSQGALAELEILSTELKRLYSSNYTCLHAKDNHSIASLLTRDAIMDLIIKYCVHLVQHEDYEDARFEMQKLDDYERQIPIIVELVFANNLMNIVKVLEFINRDVSCQVYAIALSTLFDEMVNNGFISNPEMLMIANVKSQCKDEPKLQTLMADSDQYTKPILERFAGKISIYQTSCITAFSKVNHFADVSIQKFMPRLVEEALSENHSDSGSVPTLHFVDKLFYYRHVAIGYQSLLKELKLKGQFNSLDMLMLAFHLKAYLTKHADSIEEDKNLGRAFNQIQNDIPSPIRNLIWKGESCMVQNVQYADEHLIATAGIFRNGPYRVLTWTSGEDILEADWDIDFHLYKGTLRCFISNNYWSTDNYMCQDPTQITEKNKFRVETCTKYPKDSKAAEWSITPVDITDDDSGDKMPVFTIENQGNDGKGQSRYLCAGNQNHRNMEHTTREVYTFDNRLPECYWQINCY